MSKKNKEESNFSEALKEIGDFVQKNSDENLTHKKEKEKTTKLEKDKNDLIIDLKKFLKSLKKKISQDSMSNKEFDEMQEEIYDNIAKIRFYELRKNPEDHLAKDDLNDFLKAFAEENK
jgi:hypothetical protein